MFILCQTVQQWRCGTVDSAAPTVLPEFAAEERRRAIAFYAIEAVLRTGMLMSGMADESSPATQDCMAMVDITQPESARGQRELSR